MRSGNFHPEWGYLAPAPSFMRTARVVAVATAIGATAGAAVVLSLAGRPPSDSLADNGKTLVVVRSLVQPAEAAVAPATKAAPAVAAAPGAASAPPVVASAPPLEPGVPATGAQPQTEPQPTVQASINPPPQPASGPGVPFVTGRVLPPRPSDSHSITTPTAPASVAALAEIPAVSEVGQPRDRVASAPDLSGVQKTAAKKPKDPAAQQPSTAVAGSRPRPAHTDGLGGLFRHLFSARAGSSYYPN